MDQTDFLDELDQRQNDVLERLNELNAQIETLIKTCLTERDREAAADA